jgi:nucleoside-diphosphate-sugar epimerase
MTLVGDESEVSESVFVAGSGGLVGRHVVEELLAHGHSVKALVRRSPSAASGQRPGLEIVVGDLSTPGPWERALQDVSSVVDATQVRTAGKLTVSRARQAAAERGRMTERLLAEIRKSPAPLRSYIALSGLEDYDTRGDEVFDESAPIAARPRGFAHIGLRLRPILEAARTGWGLPLVTLRMGLIYGTSGWFPDFVARLRAGRGTLVGSGQNFMGLVAAADVAQGIRRAVELAPAGREFIVTEDGFVRQSEWVGSLADMLHQSRPTFRAPLFLASWVAGRVPAETFVSSKRPSNRRMREELGVQLLYPTHREGFPATLVSLGVSPTT